MELMIEEVKSRKDLGVIMKNDGKIEDQIDKPCSKARQKAGWVLRMFYTRSTMFLKHMFNSLCQPHLNYCIQLWAPQEGPQMDKIEDVVRNFTKQIPEIRKDCYWDRLRKLKINSVIRKVQDHVYLESTGSKSS